jgi:hypothetical protein
MLAPTLTTIRFLCRTLDSVLIHASLRDTTQLILEFAKPSRDV